MYYFWLAQYSLAAFLQLASMGCVPVCWEEANRWLQNACGRQFILLSCSHLRHHWGHDWIGFDTMLSPRRLRHQLRRSFERRWKSEPALSQELFLTRVEWMWMKPMGRRVRKFLERCCQRTYTRKSNGSIAKRKWILQRSLQCFHTRIVNPHRTG